MKINEAPLWIKEFLEKKAEWWLDGDEDYLDVIEVDSDKKLARVKKDGFTYLLDINHNLIK